MNDSVAARVSELLSEASLLIQQGKQVENLVRNTVGDYHHAIQS